MSSYPIPSAHAGSCATALTVFSSPPSSISVETDGKHATTVSPRPHAKCADASHVAAVRMQGRVVPVVRVGCAACDGVFDVPPIAQHFEIAERGGESCSHIGVSAFVSLPSPASTDADGYPSVGRSKGIVGRIPAMSRKPPGVCGSERVGVRPAQTKRPAEAGLPYKDEHTSRISSQHHRCNGKSIQCPSNETTFRGYALLWASALLSFPCSCYYAPIRTHRNPHPPPCRRIVRFFAQVFNNTSRNRQPADYCAHRTGSYVRLCAHLKTRRSRRCDHLAPNEPHPHKPAPERTARSLHATPVARNTPDDTRRM
ncbi:hypothetical protein BTHE_1310 [Bifidobacterium thermophilum]|nr:hypothetical protein BTHE_1310 [Bifidobacterium thermophilum]